MSDKLIAKITVPVDDVAEQAFRSGFMQGRKEDGRIEKIAHYYGYTAQREQFEEECGEAIVAAQKCKRDGSMKAFNDLCGEVADVLIMARQMRLLMSPSLIDAIIESKLDRQIERIEDEKRTAENICTCYRDGRCWGTQDMKKCECGGNEKICDFYPTKRNKDETA